MLSSSNNYKGRAAFALLLALVMFAGLTSCGYRLASEMPSILGDGTKTLKIKNVDHPTMHAWMPYEIRSILRDEINARHMARWVDSGPADFEIEVKVVSYTTREWMRSEIDYSMLWRAALRIEAIVYRGDDNVEIWRSGPMSYDDIVESAEERSAANDLITQLIRRIVDKMRYTF